MSITHRPLHDDWTLSIVDGPAPFEARDVPATVPGTMITDLLSAGLIPDPYLDRNEHDLAWTGEVDARYLTRFTWSDRGAQRTDLVAGSLDTAATLRLNGKLVAQVQNQHRSWRFDVREHLLEGENELEILFASPLRTARENIQVLGEMPFSGNDLPYNAIRKMACNFGWDWGPVLVTSGIAGPIGLEEWSTARLGSVRPQVTLDGEDGLVDLAVGLERAGDAAPVAVEVEITDAGGVVAATATRGIPEDQDGADVRVRVPHPELWWPRGYGEQPLYGIAISIRDGEGAELDRTEHRIAFRTARVVEEPDEIGTSFTFTVNGRPVLAKGANWIPEDCFPTRLTTDDYRRSIMDAVESGMNTLRVWGGGLYESDVLYDLCDELGILVWQDFAMACAAYSEQEPLRSEIEAEAREQIVRLAWHPSLVHWNGSNENVIGYYTWGWKDKLEEGAAWGLGYYLDLFPALMAELDPTRSYSPSSPYSRGDVSKPGSPDHGTIHNWVAWWSGDDNDYTRYRDNVPRFSAEFGYQGAANYATVERMVSERPLREDSETMLSHQKASGGQDKLYRGFAAHVPAPVGYEDFHFTTQLNQARALICGIGHYRSHWPVCAGTLVWQLNDCWPVTSWAAVDGDGRRKLLWYALRDIYAPVLITVQPREDGEIVSVGNDTDEQLDSRLLLRRQDHTGQVLARTEIDVEVPPRSVASVRIPEDLATPQDADREVLVVESTEGHGRTVHFFAEDKDSALPEDAVEATVRRVDDGYQIIVSASGTVRDLCVLVDKVDPDAVAETQLHTLLAGETAVVMVRSRADLDPQAFLAPGVIMSANDLVARARGREREQQD
ncbi:glycoside hydrolase family 2 protein [Brachybacterium sp. p3-SID1565]|uniref:glycoside hydrolase family 2 protein n=1 Tax=Brachybacterium sp. p3-SID1565 TaxID=2916046 RepID=UPI0021A616C6|nr:glycoside hydrolase family 2 protein [Brachybacterium sp. p3-SID1565]MCT1385763.1 glycoside hydrolase family 2 protein [Brachybacterium sp. p3-SID1565]